MWSVTDWLLEKMNLTVDDVLDDEVEEELEEDVIPLLEMIAQKKTKEQPQNNRIFYKTVASYDDAREVIREYRQGIECVVSFNLSERIDAQGMLNYMCGAVYAFDGSVKEAGNSVFVLKRAILSQNV